MRRETDAQGSVLAAASARSFATAAATPPAAAAAQAAPGLPEEETCWVSHPLRCEPWQRTALLALAVFGWAGLAAWSLNSAAAAVVSLGVLLAALSRYWAPTAVRVDASGVQTRHLGLARQRPWSDFRRVRCVPGGLFLGPGAHPSRLDSFRGLYLRGPAAQVARAYALASRHVTA